MLELPSSASKPPTQNDKVLQTWSLDSPAVTGQKIVATQLPNHRRVYLNYEGPLTANRGTVRRELTGVLQWIRDEPEFKEVILQTTSLRWHVLIQRESHDKFIVDIRDASEKS